MSTDPRVERTKRKVELAALQLLEEGGPEAVSHQRVAERTGLSRPTIYRHWSSQTRLILAAIERRPQRIDTLNDAPIRERLIAMLESLCDELESSLSVTFLTLVARAEWEQEIREALDRRIERSVSALEEALKRGTRGGEISPSVPLETAHSLLVGPFFFERIVGGRVRSRAAIPAHVDDLLRRWQPASSAEPEP